MTEENEATDVEQAQAARAARIEALGKLKERADAGGLPLAYTVEHERLGGEKQDGLLSAGSGQLRLRVGQETVLACALGSADKVEAPRMNGRRIDITIGGEEHKIWIGEYVPTDALGPTDDDLHLGLSDQDILVAGGGGGEDVAEGIDTAMSMLGSAASALGNRAERKAWVAVIKGGSSPEDIAARHLDALLKYEVEADQIYRDEGL